MNKLDDPQIREVLKKSPTFKKFKESKVFDERWIAEGECVADVMVVDDNLHGFEIKPMSVKPHYLSGGMQANTALTI